MISRRLALLTALAPALVLAIDGADLPLPDLETVHRGTPEIDAAIVRHSGAPAAEQVFFDAARAAFEAGPQGAFADLPEIAEAAAKAGKILTGGPMLGLDGSRRLAVWVRTAKPAQVTVATGPPDDPEFFGPVMSTPGTDLTAVIGVDAPATAPLAYRILVDGVEVEALTPQFLPPRPSGMETTRIVFGADFHKTGLAHRALLERMASRKAAAALLLGDLAVDDRRNRTGLHRSDYLVRDLSPGWRALAASTPVCATWDDHDYFDNDLAGIPPRFNAADRAAVRRVWHQNWVNPGRNPASTDRGIELHTRVGPCDVIMLDTRSQRQPDGPEPFLGEAQMAWLLDRLDRCQGPFVILTSGTMWSDSISNGKDSWGRFDPAGREKIFRKLAARRLAPLLLSGDRHGARVMRVPGPGGSRLWEFELGSLGGHPGPPAFGADREHQPFGVTETALFGEFEFTGSPSQPTVTARVLDAAGKEHYSVRLTPAELMPPAP